MADPPDDDFSDYMADMSDGERKALVDKAREASSNVTPFDPKRRKKKQPPPGGWPPWYDKLRKDAGRVIPDMANVLIALREEQQLNFGMGFNEMLQCPIVLTEWPRAPRAIAVAECPHPVTDDDISRLQEWLQHMGLPRIGREMVGHAIDEYARERPIHPIRDWLSAIEHDGETRLGSWMHQCLGVPDDEYHRQIGAMFLIAMVARIFEPGCKCDYMIVLEGPQGEEKSKFCRALAGGDEYFSEHLPRIDGDQVRLSMHLRGVWVAEVSELAAFLKADPEAMKEFTSRRVERYTPKYGRIEVREARQCVFVGTTNEDDYIRDVTGGRRYWPIQVRFVDLEKFAKMREQLFAEAVEAYRSGKPWWPDRDFERSTIAPIQDDRQWDDAWAEKVHDIIALRTAITTLEIGSLMGIDTARFDMLAQKRIAAIMRKAKWRRGKQHGSGPIWRKPE